MKVGDLVRLKSGGPAMTVARVEECIPTDKDPGNGTGNVDCRWFDAEGKWFITRFHSDELELIGEKNVC